MYVRFGQDNDLRDGMVVTDYSSRGPTGNEEIVITRQSDPPLRAGTYFVSLGVFDTGVVARCTLTAEMELDEEAPPPISGGPLVPGQPADFRLGPVDNPTLFNRDFSFRLEVPENPYRVTLTVTMDSFINVDLYVRFGEDNDLRNKRVVSDYASERLFGNEEIVITLRSDPPLRAGTYFISLGVRTTGVVAEGTVTAIVERNVPISGGPLTPGQPAAFRLGPVDTPTIFFGNDSFRLEVPENATRVIFTLESVDPDVDVALFVRYGEDNTFQNGRLVFDYRDFERIGITRRSDPPLRAGTYFVSLTVYDMGIVAEGTVTATVETDAEDCHLDVTCYSEWSTSATSVATIVFETSGGTSSRCSGTLLTNRRQDFTPYFLTAAHCVDTEAEARSVTAYWFYQTQTCNGELPDFQTVPRTEGAHLLATLGGAIEERVNPDGDMTLLQLEGDLPDGVWFQGWDANPQPIGAQVTGIHHPGNDDWGFFKRLSFGQIIPDPGFGTFEDDVYAVVSYTQGYTQPGSSGSALFNNPGTVVGATSRGSGTENICRIGGSLSVYTHFSVFYPHIRQFIDSDSLLTPGQPATFRLEPVDTPTIFLGGSSFRLEVPDNASRVTFTLESVDPDINVDLYVRYGEDNDIRDGRVISDYSSEGPTGNEEIIITRQSDPPLRAGTYFVSLGVRTTGVVAEGTVRAEFDTHLQTGDQIYYFPHLAVGASWQTTITYINYSREEVSCQTDFISDHGSPLMVSFAELGTVDSRTDVLPPGGSVHQETDVDLSAPLAPGWARATCTGPVQASLLFRWYSSEGMPTAEAGVNAATVPATRFVTFAEQGEGKNGTGVAYANPSDTAALVTFTARDADGEVLVIEDLMLPPNWHGAQNMPTLFDLSSFTGSLEVTSTEPIVSLSLNFEAAPVFSSLPPGETPAGEIPASDVPDLVVQTPSVSDSSPNAGESFMLSATVRNQGNGRSASTTLRYYHSLDATISTGDTEVGTDTVGSLTAAASSDQSISLTAPSSAGTYYYGACVDPVSGEYATRNNCSRAVTVTVASSTGDPWSRPNIERFRGTWQFTYTKDRAAITDTFVLSIIIEQSDEPGEWLIGGIQDDGVVAVLLYSRVSDSYVLATAAAVTPDEIEELYSFNLTSPTTVSGCYYEILSSTSLSSCYPMTGVKTSSSTLSSLQRAQPNTTAAQPELDSKIIRVLEDLQEDLREVLRQ